MCTVYFYDLGKSLSLGNVEAPLAKCDHDSSYFRVDITCNAIIQVMLLTPRYSTIGSFSDTTVRITRKITGAS